MRMEATREALSWIPDVTSESSRVYDKAIAEIERVEKVLAVCEKLVEIDEVLEQIRNVRKA